MAHGPGRGRLSDDLQARRERIREIDRRVVDLVAERVRLAREIGAIKRREGLPIRNYTVEAEVIRQARATCEAHGLDPRVGEELAHVLIEEAVRAQEADIRRASGRQLAGRALVVGGSGNMGRWFCEFLESKGYDVAVTDPRGAVEGYAYEPDVARGASAADVVLVAVPPAAVASVLDAVPDHARAVVLDISSLKSPCLDALRRAKARGLRATSLHPMWGPATRTLAGKNLVVCSVGDAEADRVARSLFEDTAARVVELPVEAHDAAMAYTLGLPHALNLVFGRVLAGARPVAELEPLAGPTFLKQARVAAEVAGENKDLYHQIQKLNAHTPRVYAELRRAVDELEKSLDDPEAFRAYMAACERTLGAGAPRAQADGRRSP